MNDIISDCDTSLFFLKRIEEKMEKCGKIKLSGEVTMCRARLVEIREIFRKDIEEEPIGSKDERFRDGNGYF